MAHEQLNTNDNEYKKALIYYSFLKHKAEDLWLKLKGF